MRTILALALLVMLAPAGRAAATLATPAPAQSPAAVAAATPGITRAPFGSTTHTTPIPVELFTLTNASGAQVKITNYGGIVTSILVPDRNGAIADVVLGYDDLASYLRATPYFGAIVGRYGNRIDGGRFTLDGVEYQVTTNEQPNDNILHGGAVGFDKKVWHPEPRMTAAGPALELSIVSPDGDEGFPGNLSVTAIYTWTDAGELKLDFTATTDKATVVNLTNHCYFNLAGHDSGDILGHQVMINSDRITPVDATLIPTGEYMPVAGTPFDFTTPHAIGERINADNEQIKFGGGYDHCWVINEVNGKMPVGTPMFMARVVEPNSGRVLEVLSTEPGLQFYSGNFLDGSNIGKGGAVYNHRNAFCMEPQHFPDSPNKPDFPSTTLRPGQTYRHSMIYRFTTAQP